jgi:hypothetical protein
VESFISGLTTPRYKSTTLTQLCLPSSFFLDLISLSLRKKSSTTHSLFSSSPCLSSLSSLVLLSSHQPSRLVGASTEQVDGGVGAGGLPTSRGPGRRCCGARRQVGSGVWAGARPVAHSHRPPGGAWSQRGMRAGRRELPGCGERRLQGGGHL